MSMHFAQMARSFAAGGLLSGEELLQLRREAWADGRITHEEAEALFALNAQLRDASPQWVDFFAEAVAAFVLDRCETEGTIDSATAAWLIGQIDADGEIRSLAEIEALIRVFDRAAAVPQAFKDYAISQMEMAVREGVGPTREPGRLTATEARLLRSSIFAPVSEGFDTIGRKEAETLFRIKDAALGADNAPEFRGLFVQGIADFVSAYARENAQLDRDRRIALRSFMADCSGGIGGFLCRLARIMPDAFERLFDPGGSEDGTPSETKRPMAPEHQWLDARIGADQRIDVYEQALLDFLVER